MPGTLYVVATPIGHLDDISLRALETLKAVKLIACEDTRHSKKLLNHFGIATPLFALHAHNEEAFSDVLIERLVAGDDIALISDAGTPLISDPGCRLVAQAKDCGITVSPLPGACAAIAALSVAGLPSHAFHFVGFLSSKSGARKKQLATLAHESPTLIFYEAPHRIIETLSDMVAVFGQDRMACLAREITKTFETVLRMPLCELLALVQKDPNQSRGEMVVLVQGDSQKSHQAHHLSPEHIYQLLQAELPPSKAAKLAAKITGVSKKSLYLAGDS